MKRFKVYSPKNLEGVLQCLREAQGEIKLLAGGTDLVIQLREGSVNPDAVIDISGISELKSIKEEEGFVKIGAACSFTEIAENDLVKKYAFCLAEAASQVGSEQIRNTGTIGGNIANASPAADALPALVALDSSVTVFNTTGEARQVPVNSVSAGAGKNNLAAGEIITEIVFPALGNTWRSAFAKLGRRKALAIARINMAAAVEYDAEERVLTKARVALGAVGTVAFRPAWAEEVLIGGTPSPQLNEAFVESLSRAVEESIPGRASMPYKKAAIRGVGSEVFEKLFPGL
ncbi:hypothetical protein SY88_10465 [Clostridiales bacterium PH28_bin88]|nr:hypothetical protein SY88_10465 [Clostridiales bacterium PH28_bin88]